MAAGKKYEQEEADFLAHQWVVLERTNREAWQAHSEVPHFPNRAIASLASARNKNPDVLAAIARAESGEVDLPDWIKDPDGQLHVDEDQGVVYVSGVEHHVTPEELFERSGLDADEWEFYDGETKVWTTAMKLRNGDVETPHVIEQHGCRIRVRLRPDRHFEFRPRVIEIIQSRPAAPSGGGFSSLHFSDIHFPHHDPRALDIVLQVADIIGPDIVVDHGDTLDCEQISKYPKDPFNRTDLSAEVDMAARWFGQIHALTPDARHIWLEGNHEKRLQKEIWARCERDRVFEQILRLPGVVETLSWGHQLGLDGLGWEIVPYPKHILLFDRFICAHGSVVRKDSSLSARAQYDKYGKSGASGHTHRMGAFHHTDYRSPRVWLELGMLGQIRADYVDHANWQQGFAVLTWNDDRTRFGVEQIEVIDGVAYFRGMRLEGSDADPYAG